MASPAYALSTRPMPGSTRKAPRVVTFTASLDDLANAAEDLPYTGARPLPRDNRTRLEIEGPHRTITTAIARRAWRTAHALEAFSGKWSSEDTAYAEALLEDAEATLHRYFDMIDELVAEAHAELVAHQAEHHRLLTELARTLEAAEPAEAARIHHHEPRPAPPPGAELVAVVSLAPHAPPAEARLHASPEGVT